MAETSVFPVALPYTGISSVDTGFRILSQQLARASGDIKTALNLGGGGGGGTTDAPTNNPVPTGISVLLNPDGSMDVTLSWNYTQGAIPADYMVLFWKQGAASLAAPNTQDKAILLASTARTYTFQGWNPNSNYRFAIAAGRKSGPLIAIIVGNVVAPTSTPDWADISAVGDYTGLVGGTSASTLVTGIAAGQTAFNETVNYRTAGAPTNNPVPVGLISGTDSDGSARYTLSWNYTQGARKGEGFFFFVKEGDTGTFALTDPHFELGAQNAGTFSSSITLKGYPSDRAVSFGVACFRRTELGLEIGPIQTSAAAPDWQGVTTGTPNYAGTIFGLEQHNFTVTASGVSATDTNSKLQRDGADLLWTGRDEEFQGGPGGVYGKSYNLTIYDLVAKQALYQHCFNLVDYGATISAAHDLFTRTQSGGGILTLNESGKFGKGIKVTAPVGTDRAYLATQAASANYSALQWVECWVKRNGNPSQAGTLVSLGSVAPSDSGYVAPVLRLNVDGTVTGQAWDGAALQSVTSVATVTDNLWHHVAVAQNAGAVHLWIDGVRVAGGAGLTSLTMSAPSLFITLGYSSAGQLVGDTFIDELIVSTNSTLRANAANFTVPDREASDRFGGAAGIVGIWHFEEPALAFPPCNSRVASKALANLIASYGTYQLATPGVKLLFILGGANEPAVNRLVNGLPDALAAIGGRRALFTAGSFQTGAAYILLGRPGVGEGNGYEAYAGKVANDTEAHVEVSFQTQGVNIVAGTGGGWDPLDVPGPPTNNPTPTSVSVTSSPTGEDTLAVNWSYSQPALSGNSKLADGFIVYVKSGDDASPAVSPTAGYQVGIDSRSFTMQSPLNQSWSFAVATFRRTSSGLEIGPAVTSSSGPDWQGIGGTSQVTNSGLADGSVTDPKITTVGSTKIIGNLTINPVGNIPALKITGGGDIELDSDSLNESQINFTGGGVVRMQIKGQASGFSPELRIAPSSDLYGTLRLGESATRWDFASVKARAFEVISDNFCALFSNQSIDLHPGGVQPVKTFGDHYISGELRGCSPITFAGVPFSTYLIGGRIVLRDLSGNFVGYIPLITTP